MIKKKLFNLFIIYIEEEDKSVNKLTTSKN
jgi:hypothetical protein